MRNKNYTFNVYRLLMLCTLLLGGILNNIYAQSFSVDTDQSSNPADSKPDNDDDNRVYQYIAGETLIKAHVENFIGVDNGDSFFLYYNQDNNSSIQDAESIISSQTYDSSWGTSRTISASIDEVGDYYVFIGHFTGRLDYVINIDNEEDIASLVGASVDGNYLRFNKSGNRLLTTNAFDLSGESEGDVFLQVPLFLFNDDSNPIVVEYSTNGGSSYSALLYNDGTEDVSEIYSGSGFPDSFELPASALRSATLFRIKQINASDLEPSEKYFTVGSMSITKGEAIQEANTYSLGMFSIVSEHDDTNPIPSVNGLTAKNSGTYKYPGEKVEFTMTTTNIDSYSGLSLYVSSGGGEYNKVAIKTQDAPNNQLTFDYALPIDIEAYYGSSMSVTAKLVDGDEVVNSTGGFDNIVTTGDVFFNEENLVGSNSVAANTINFTLLGARQYTTLPVGITNENKAKLSATIKRLNTAVPTVGSDIVIEYSTNGINWIKLGDDIPLGGTDGVGTAGKFFEFDLDANIVSETTQFRVRQLTADNREDINTWQIQDFKLYVEGDGGNVIGSRSTNVYIASPSLSVELKNSDNQVIYPGDNVTFTISDVDSEFNLPEFTYIEVYYTSYTDNSLLINKRFLRTLDELEDGDFDVTIPFDEGGYKKLSVRVVIDGINPIEVSAPFTVQSPVAEITSVSTDFTDNDIDYSIAGKSIEVGYQMASTNSKDVAYMSLEYQFEGEWFSFAQQDISSKTGTISAELPKVDMGSTTADLRIAVLPKQQDDSFASYTFADFTSIGSNYPNEYRYIYNVSAEVGAKYAVDVTVRNETETEEYDETYYVSAWKTITTNPVIENNVYQTSVIDFSSYKEVPEDIISASGTHRIGITKEDDVNLRRLRVLTPYKGLVTSEIEQINVAYPTVSLSDIEEFYGSQFYSAQEMELQYSTFAIEEGDAKFAIYLEQGTEYIMLDVCSEVGLVNRTVTMPTSTALTDAGFNLGTSFDINIVAFNPADEAAVLSDLNKTFLQDDFSGYGFSKSYSGGYFYFEGKEQRSIVSTEKYNLEGLIAPVTLTFDYWADIDYPTASTLPKLQISTDDGETYTSIEVEESEYASLKCLDTYGNHSYSVVIPEQYLTESIYIRFIQEVVSGASQNRWRVNNVRLAGDNNLLDYVKLLPGERQINYFVNDEYAPYNNFDAYQMTVTSFDYENENNFLPEVREGETITLDWKPVYSEDGELVRGIEWPENTVFEFSIPCNDNNDYHTLQFDGSTDEFEFTLADSIDVTTGIYNIEVRAFILDEEGEVLYQYPAESSYDPYKTVYTVEGAYMKLLFINETTPTLLRLNAEQLTSTDFYLADTAVVKYQLHGQWTEDIKIAGVLELFDSSDDLIERQVLEITDELIGDSIAVKIPNYVDEADNYRLKLYPFIGDAIDFGEEVEIEDEELIVYGGSYSSSYNRYYMGAEGDRSATTPLLELGGKENVVWSFDYNTYGITENLATLLQVEVSTDGENFFPLVVDEMYSDYGNQGYLSTYNNSYSSDYNFKNVKVQVPNEYISNSTQFRISQESSLIEDKETWRVRNFKYTCGDRNIVDPNEELYQSQVINILQASVNNYDFALVRDEDGFEPVLFPADEAKFTFTTNGVSYPEGTEFSFYLDGYKDEPLMIASAADTEFAFTLPDDIIRGSYDVYVEVVNEDFVYEELVDEDGDLRNKVGVINVYNHVLKAVINQDEVLYAGNKVSVSGVYENSDRTPSTDYYYNLILEDSNGDDWLLATQYGSAEFADVQLPTYINGNREFRIEATLNEAIGSVGEKVVAFDNMEVMVDGSSVTWTSAIAIPASHGSYDVDKMTFNISDAPSYTRVYISTNGGDSYSNLYTSSGSSYFYNGSHEVDLSGYTNDFVLKFVANSYSLGMNISNINLKYNYLYTTAWSSTLSSSNFVTEDNFNNGTDSYYTYEYNKSQSTRYENPYISFDVSGKTGNISLEISYDSGNTYSYLGDVAEGSNSINLDNSDDSFRFRFVIAQDPTTVTFSNSKYYYYYRYENNYSYNIFNDFENRSLISSTEGERIHNETKVLDLTTIESVKFDVMASSLAVTDNQKLKFEYSIDGGSTFTTIESYPNNNFVEDGDELSETIALPAEARTVATILRWRVEEYKESFTLGNVELEQEEKDYVPAPITAEGSYRFISDQEINIEDVVYTPSCEGGSVELFYNIKGRFGADNKMKVRSTASSNYYRTTSSSNDEITWDGITEGSGSITLNFSDVYYFYAGELSFSMKAEDYTESDYDVVVYGEYSLVTNNIYRVDTDNLDVVSDGNTCSGGDRIATVQGVQNLITYQLVNVATGNTIGEAVTIDTEDEDLMDSDTYPYYDGYSLEINMGQLTAETVVDVKVSVLGSECERMANNEATFYVGLTPAIYYTDALSNGLKLPVAAGQTFEVCEGSNPYTFYFGYYRNGTWNNTYAKWMSGDFTIEDDSDYRMYSSVGAGTYTVVYNACDNLDVVSFTIAEGQTPTQPMLTYEGETRFCEGEGLVTLVAPEEYAAYEWLLNGSYINTDESSSNKLEVAYVQGTYAVRVLTDAGCTSTFSNYVEVEITQKPEMPDALQQCTTDSTVMVKVYDVEENHTYRIVNYETGESLSHPFSVNTNSSSVNVYITANLAERVEAVVVAQNSLLEACMVESASFFVSSKMFDIVAYGNILEAESTVGSVSDYVWYRNGKRMNKQQGNSSITIYDDAHYTVTAVSHGGCKLEASFGELAINEEEPELEASIYPNPAANFVNLKVSNHEGDVNVKLYDVSGVLRGSYSYKVEGNDAGKQIDLSNVSTGYFNLEVSAGDKTIVKRFIKN